MIDPASWVHLGVMGLAVLSFIEAVFFPVPPDVILIPLALADPQNALLYALVATVFSSLGGLGGHYIGSVAGKRLVGKIVSREHTEQARKIYGEHGPLALALAALTPVPYKVFTILSGALGMGLKTLFLVSLIGRGLRFFAEAILVSAYGEAAIRVISANFELATISAGALIIVLYACYIYIRKKFL
ncbi:MAG: VTT domain-containing protein [Candidatus Micrarchaeia archaeon]